MILAKLELSEISLGEYSKKNLDSRFLSVLEDLVPDKMAKVRRCRKFVRLGRCDDGEGEHRFLRGSLCRLRDLCPVDASGMSQDQAVDAYDTLALRARRLDGNRERLFVGVFTLPRQAWNRVPDSGLNEFRKVGADTIKEMFSANGRLGLYFRIDAHFWHSSDVCGEWYPHLHLSVSSIAWDHIEKKHVRISRELYQHDMRGNHENSKLAKCWRKNFERKYGTVTSRRINAWWGYREGQAGITHWLRYSNRNPVMDLYKEVVRGRLVYTGSDLQRSWLARLLVRSRSEKRAQWYDIASDGVKSKYLKKLEIVLPRKDARRKARARKMCPKCGTEIVFDRREMSLGEAERAYPGLNVLCSVRKPKTITEVPFWSPVVAS